MRSRQKTFSLSTLPLALLLLSLIWVSTTVRADRSDRSSSAAGEDQWAQERVEKFNIVVKAQLDEHRALWRKRLAERYASLGDKGRRGSSWSELAVRLFEEHGWVFVDALSRAGGGIDPVGDEAWSTKNEERLQGELAAMEAIESEPDDALFVVIQAGPAFAKYAPKMSEALGRPDGAAVLARLMYPIVLARVHARSADDNQDAANLAALASSSEDVIDVDPTPAQAVYDLERQQYVLGMSGDAQADRDDHLLLDEAARALTCFFTKVLSTRAERDKWLKNLEDDPGIGVVLAMVGLRKFGGQAAPTDEELAARLSCWKGILENEGIWLDCNDLGQELGAERYQADALCKLETMNPSERRAILRNATGLGASLFTVLGEDSLWKLFLELRPSAAKVGADEGEEWLCMFFATNPELLEGMTNDAPFKERLISVIQQAADNISVSGEQKRIMPDLQALLSPVLLKLIVEDASSPDEARKRMVRLGKISEAKGATQGDVNWSNVLQLLGIGAGKTYLGDVLAEMAGDLLRDESSDDEVMRRKQQALIRGLASVAALEKMKSRYGESEAGMVAEILNQSELMLKNCTGYASREVAAYFISDLLAEAASASVPEPKLLLKARDAFVRLKIGFSEFDLDKRESAEAGDYWVLVPKGDSSWIEYLPGYDLYRVGRLLLNGVTPDASEIVFAAIDAVSFIPMVGVAGKAIGAGAKGAFTLGKATARNLGKAAIRATSTYAKRGAKGLASDLARHGWRAGKKIVANGRKALVALKREAFRESSQRMTKAAGKGSAGSARKAAGVVTRTASGRAGSTATALMRANAGVLPSLVRRSGGGLFRAFSAANLKTLALDAGKALLQATGRALMRGLKWLGNLAVKFGPWLAGGVLVKYGAKNLLNINGIIADIAGLFGTLGDNLRKAIDELVNGGIEAALKSLGLDWLLEMKGATDSLRWAGWGILAVLGVSLMFGLAGRWTAAKRTLSLPVRWIGWSLMVVGALGWGLWKLGASVRVLFARKSTTRDREQPDIEPASARKAVSVMILGRSKAGKTCTLAALRRLTHINAAKGGGSTKKELEVAYEDSTEHQILQEAERRLFDPKTPDWPNPTPDEAGILKTRFVLGAGGELDTFDIAGKTVERVVHAFAQDDKKALSKEAKSFKGAVEQVDALWVVLDGRQVCDDCNEVVGSADTPSTSQWASALSKIVGDASEDRQQRIIVTVTNRDLIVEAPFKDEIKDGEKKIKEIEKYVSAVFNANGLKPDVCVVQTVNDFDDVDKQVSAPNTQPASGSTEQKKPTTDADKAVHKKPKIGAKPGPGIADLQKCLVEAAKSVLGIRRRDYGFSIYLASVSVAVLVALGILAGFKSQVVAENLGQTKSEYSHQRSLLASVENKYLHEFAEAGQSMPLRRYLGAAWIEEQLKQYTWLESLKPEASELERKYSAAKEDAHAIFKKGPPAYSGRLPNYVAIRPPEPEQLKPEQAQTRPPKVTVDEIVSRVGKEDVNFALQEVRNYCAEHPELSRQDRERLEDALVKSLNYVRERSENVFKKEGYKNEKGYFGAAYYVSILLDYNWPISTPTLAVYAKALADVPDADVAESSCRSCVASAQTDALVLQELLNTLNASDKALFESIPGAGLNQRWGDKFAKSLDEFQNFNRVSQVAGKVMWSELQRREYVKIRNDWIEFNTSHSGTRQFSDGNEKLKARLEGFERDLKKLDTYDKEGYEPLSKDLKTRTAEMRRWLSEVKGRIGGDFSIALTGWEMWKLGDGSREGYVAVALAWGQWSKLEHELPNWREFKENDFHTTNGRTLQGSGWNLGFRTGEGLLAQGNLPGNRHAGKCLTHVIRGAIFSPFVLMDVMIEHDGSGPDNFSDGVDCEYEDRAPDFGEFYERFGWGLDARKREGEKGCCDGMLRVGNQGAESEKSTIWLISDLPTPPLPRGSAYRNDGTDIKAWLPEYGFLGHSFK